jgi:hypothetical protein
MAYKYDEMFLFLANLVMHCFYKLRLEASICRIKDSFRIYNLANCNHRVHENHQLFQTDKGSLTVPISHHLVRLPLFIRAIRAEVTSAKFCTNFW